MTNWFPALEARGIRIVVMISDEIERGTGMPSFSSMNNTLKEEVAPGKRWEMISRDHGLIQKKWRRCRYDAFREREWEEGGDTYASAWRSHGIIERGGRNGEKRDGFMCWTKVIVPNQASPLKWEKKLLSDVKSKEVNNKKSRRWQPPTQRNLVCPEIYVSICIYVLHEHL